MLRRQITSTLRWSPATTSAWPGLRFASSSGFLGHPTRPALRTDAKTVRKPGKFDQFSYSDNLEYLAYLQEQYKTDKDSVDSSWHPILDALESAPPNVPIIDHFTRPVATGTAPSDLVTHMRIAWMVRAWEYRGHHLANIDPLGLGGGDLSKKEIPLGLDPRSFGFSDADLDRTFNVKIGPQFGSLLVGVDDGGQKMTLRQIVDECRKIYAGRIGFEFMHAGSVKVREWFRTEILSTLTPTKEERLTNLNEIIKACGFEHFLFTKYGTQKRFGLDGGESLIAGVNAAIDELEKGGSKKIVLGMAHRGRLNTLVNVGGKSLELVLNEFEGRTPVDEVFGTGDVKYHLGTQNEVKTLSGGKINVTVLPNPSHLECVNPLILGRTRVLQEEFSKSSDNAPGLDHAVPFLLHGDAAFTGQGVCYETTALEKLPHFDVGGTIHIVTNNQIGFTTDVEDGRPSSYASDLAKAYMAPVIHVNGDDVDQVVRALRIAAKFRHDFHRDVVIDLVIFRRAGHNETDVPAFTQPVMYKTVAKHPRVVDSYGEQLVKDGVLSAAELKQKIQDDVHSTRDVFETALSSDKYIKVKDSSKVQSFVPPPQKGTSETGVPVDVLRQVGMAVTEVPSDFNLHPKAQKPVDARREAIETGKGVEWGLAEALAMGSLVRDGYSVRLTGEDVERGTFSQRFAVFVDAKNNQKYTPLQKLDTDKAHVTIASSALSEYGVCGYEAGYAAENSKTLCVWEAQFGDFANGAQVIIDQFLSSGEAKWNQKTGLVLSLPHGYDGQGPEHSSSRMERYLQLCHDTHELPKDFSPQLSGQELRDLAESRIQVSNWQLVYPSQPANYFHLLRRQVLRNFRKPLIMPFAKSGLRAPNLSDFDEMVSGTDFSPVITRQSSPDAPASAIRKVVLCSGHIERKFLTRIQAIRSSSKDESAHSDIAFVLLEQIAPFPFEHVARAVQPYLEGGNPNLQIVWLQEEPKNMGAWSFLRPRLNSLLQHIKQDPSFRIPYVGRRALASPATGYESVHNKEESTIFEQIIQ